MSPVELYKIERERYHEREKVRIEKLVAESRVLMDDPMFGYVPRSKAKRVRKDYKTKPRKRLGPLVLGSGAGWPL